MGGKGSSNGGAATAVTIAAGWDHRAIHCKDAIQGKLITYVLGFGKGNFGWIRHTGTKISEKENCDQSIA